MSVKHKEALTDTPRLSGADGRLSSGSHRAPVVPSRHHYDLVSVEKTDMPADVSGQDWHRYVIRSGGSVITGCRRGSQHDVRQYALDFASQLNARSGTVPRPAWTPRTKL